MHEPGRTWYGTGAAFRYSHNSHEQENAIFANAQSAEYWMYDSRIIRRWNVDPIVDESLSPYACFANNPVLMADPLGLKPDWKLTWKKFVAFLHHPFDGNAADQHAHGRHVGEKGHSGRHWSVGQISMNLSGALRFGSRHHLPLIPQGNWEKSDWTEFDDLQGELRSGQNSDAIPINSPKGEYKKQIDGIRIQLTDDGGHGYPIGYARVTGIYKFGNRRAAFRTTFANTGLSAILPKNNGGVYGGGAAGNLTDLPEWLIEGHQFILGIFGPELGMKIVNVAGFGNLFNNRVNGAFRNASAIRVENIGSINTMHYKLSLRYRQWNWIIPGDRRSLWKRLHDVTNGEGAGFSK